MPGSPASGSPAPADGRPRSPPCRRGSRRSGNPLGLRCTGSARTALSTRENRSSFALSGQRSGSSPPTRGAHLVVADRVPLDGIIPAYAGRTRATGSACTTSQDHPRLRGEHIGPTPRALRGGRIIPAYAGSTANGVRMGRSFGDHPRLRGEHASLFCSQRTKGGSSPPMRGAPVMIRCSLVSAGIIPAYAGSTWRASSIRCCASDHPRLRGEHLEARLEAMRPKGSSPPTRGALPAHELPGRLVGIIPAYAGSTVAPQSRQTRGPGSSPPTRGALRRQAVREAVCRIIPAYAGSTRPSAPYPLVNADHPRLRGEHAAFGTLSTRERGSSPPTRGAPGDAVRLRADPGIIPAYAGSTC